MVGTDPVTGAAPTRNADFHTSALMLAPVLQLRRACDGNQVYTGRARPGPGDIQLYLYSTKYGCKIQPKIIQLPNVKKCCILSEMTYGFCGSLFWSCFVDQIAGN